jgi:DDE superfamily endonuclease
MKEKVGRSRRLLIVDEYSSHINMAFITAADDRRIILLILPPHSTHRLQPLDVGLFSPLAKAYTKGLNDLMFHSLGLVNMNKQLF